MLSRRDQQVDEGRTEMAENSFVIRCDQAEEMVVNKRFDKLLEVESAIRMGVQKSSHEKKHEEATNMEFNNSPALGTPKNGYKPVEISPYKQASPLRKAAIKNMASPHQVFAEESKKFFESQITNNARNILSQTDYKIRNIRSRGYSS